MTKNSSPDSTGLQLLHVASVDAQQIDQLGHMNVRFYGIHALAGARALVTQLGLPGAAAGESPRALFRDFYTRHYSEQLVGSPLEVWGGVLDVGDADMRIYCELRNPEQQNLGATFVFLLQHEDGQSQVPMDLPAEIAGTAQQQKVAWPEHGRPRSLDIQKPQVAISLQDIQALGVRGYGARAITAENCDSDGRYKSEAFHELVWQETALGNENDWITTMDNGDPMSWATMESRFTMLELPRVGSRVQTFSATVAVTRKARRENLWVYDTDSSRLLCAAAFVDVAFNLKTRRAIEISQAEREKIEQQLRAELA